MNRKLRSFLKRRGASAEEIARAEREGGLLLLAFDYQLLPGPPRYTFEEASRRADFDLETARRLWRALGFPDPPPDARLFRDEDVEAMILIRRQIESTIVPVGENNEYLVQIVRVVAGSLAKIAEVESDALGERSTRSTRGRDARRRDRGRGHRGSRLVETVATHRLRVATPATRVSARRKLTASNPTAVGAEDLAVGFVDLVGYTALSQELEPEELAALVTRFEELAYDTVAEYAGRVVEDDRRRGDVRRRRHCERGPDRPASHGTVSRGRGAARRAGGLAAGSALSQEGDYFGPVVNLASRLVELARPGTVLVSSEVHDALAEDPRSCGTGSEVGGSATSDGSRCGRSSAPASRYGTRKNSAPIACDTVALG